MAAEEDYGHHEYNATAQNFGERRLRKARFLELFARLCGWMWIGAACASIYFLYVALAGAAPWSILLWSIGAGLIAKILAAVLNMNKLCSDSQHATESTSGGSWFYRIG